MAKVSKQDLDKLTEDATRVAGLALSMLIGTQCPYRDEYEKVDRLVETAERLREGLGLPPLRGEDGRIKEHKPERKLIGFQLPEKRGEQ